MCKHILILAQFSLFFNSENKSTWVFENAKNVDNFDVIFVEFSHEK